MRIKAKITSILCAFCVVLSMQNCGEFSSMQDENYSGALDFGASPIDSNDTEQRVPFQMITKKQIVASMVTSAGLVEADSDLKSMTLKYKPVLSVMPDLVQYNPPRAMTYANISGEVCRQLISQEKKEKNKRLIRHGLPAEYTSITQTELDETIRSLARSFWSRNETTEEHKIIMDSLDEYSRDIASLSSQVKSERQILFLCTAMLASVDSITY